MTLNQAPVGICRWLSHQRSPHKKVTVFLRKRIPFGHKCNHLSFKHSNMECDEDIPSNVIIRTQTRCWHKKRLDSNQLLPTGGLVKLTLVLIRDHHATLTTTFPRADTKYIVVALTSLQTFCNTIATEHSYPILKYNLHKTTLLKQIPFSQFSQKQPPLYSKIFNLAVTNQIIIPGYHIRVIKFRLEEITNSPIRTTIQTSVTSLQLLRPHFNHLNFTENHDPNPQAQYVNVIPENITNDPIGNPTGMLEYIVFPQKKS